MTDGRAYQLARSEPRSCKWRRYKLGRCWRRRWLVLQHIVPRWSLTESLQFFPSLRSILPTTRLIPPWRRIRTLTKMQSASGHQALSDIVCLCAAVRQLIENYAASQSPASEPSLDPFRVELQTLSQYLDLFEKIRGASEHRLDIEISHLGDVRTLLHRCHRTLLVLHASLQRETQSNSEVGQPASEAAPLECDAPNIRTARFFISFYSRTLEMSLIAFNL